MNWKTLSVKKKWLIGLTAALVLLIVLALILEFTVEDGKKGTTNPEDLAKELVLSVIEDKAKAIMAELKLAAKDMLDENPESAKQRVASISKEIDSLRGPVEQGIKLLKVAAPSKAKRLEDAQVLLDVADSGLQEIMVPAIDLMAEYPISALKAGEGFNTHLMIQYLNFAETVMPTAEVLLEKVNSVDLTFLGGEVASYLSYLESVNKAMDFYRENPEVLPVLKSALGAEGDRLYVIAVQNPSEIRASGGFPGSMGTVRIQNGILTVGDFTSVVNMMSKSTPKGITITPEEWDLFRHLSGIQDPRDADLCPDFERVGHIWTMACQEMLHENVDGVIAVSPHIVQRLLKAMGEEIELFDGSVINGDNALKVLIHDIYFDYFSKDSASNGATVSDQLFEEAAKKTLEKLTGDVSVSRLLSYLPVVKKSVADRTLMFWLKNEQEQAFISKIGWSGGLNQDPNKPEAGIYFSNVLASKLGWYVLMDAYMEVPTRNEDGSYTYPVTVTLLNIATTEEMKQATKYISGGQGGKMVGVAYFFAPAGGRVSNFDASNGRNIQKKTYHGLELGYMDVFMIKPGETVTVTYSVTTAPGVDTPLKFSKTPTAQDYHSLFGVG